MTCAIYHVNWHTSLGAAVFLNAEHETWLTDELGDVARKHGLPLMALGVMPNHVPVVFATLHDLPRDEIVRLLKGGTSRRFFESFPDFRADLGPALWARGYH